MAGSLSFGALAAERERNLPDLFVPVPSFERLCNGSKIITLGNRGVGKTALLTMLRNDFRSRSWGVVDLAPEDFGYELLSASLASEQEGSFAKQGAYAAAWKHLLYVLAMKEAIGLRSGLKTGAAKRIHKYVRDNYSGIDLNPLGALISYLKRLEGLKLGPIDASVKARELHRLYRLEELEPYLDDLDELCRASPVVLLVDELDTGWDGSEDSIAFVAGLFMAATGLATRTPHVRVVMSLRRELYESVPLLADDAQKYRDVVEVLEWDERWLLELIGRRITYSTGESAASPLDAWYAVMPPTVRGRDSFEHVLNFTLFRPRELIAFCSTVQDLLPDPQAQIVEADILRAQALFSRDRFMDIVSEYRFQYPGIQSVFETFRGKPRLLDRSDLELHCLEISVAETSVDPTATWVRVQDVDDLIDVLWRVGFVQCEIEASGERRYVGFYQHKTINVRNVARFRVHDMFAEHLGLGP